MNYSTRMFLNRLREKLDETRSATLNAATSGTCYVMQRPDGTVLSTRTGFFSTALREAHGVSPDAPEMFGATAVPVEEARQVLLEKIAEAAAEVEARLADG